MWGHRPYLQTDRQTDREFPWWPPGVMCSLHWRILTCDLGWSVSETRWSGNLWRPPCCLQTCCSVWEVWTTTHTWQHTDTQTINVWRYSPNFTIFTIFTVSGWRFVDVHRDLTCALYTDVNKDGHPISASSPEQELNVNIPDTSVAILNLCVGSELPLIQLLAWSRAELSCQSGLFNLFNSNNLTKT